MDAAIEFSNVSKRFTLYHQRSRSLQEAMIQFLDPRAKKAKQEDFWALRDVTLAVPRGKTVGLIGSNGSGKSTALKLMAGILQPTTGAISVRGRVSALLELGAGMHLELTGRENVFLNGTLLGWSNAEMEALYPQIVDFSELERFIDMPVKHYSSGMYMRLAFSVAIHVRPDILLLDEVMSVGDQSFQTKCMERIYDMRKRGTTIVIVNHGVQTLEEMCDELLWLHKGELMGHGDTHDVASDYMMFMHGPAARLSQAPPTPEPVATAAPPVESAPAEAPAPEPTLASEPEAVAEVASVPDAVENEQEAREASDSEIPLSEAEESADSEASEETPAAEEPQEPAWRWGSYEVEITDVTFRRNGNATFTFFTGDRFTVEISYIAHEPVTDPMFGIAIHHRGGAHVAGPNNQFARVRFGTIEGRGKVTYSVPDFPLLQGHYELSASIYDRAGIHGYDTHWRAYPFVVQPGGTRERYGLIRMGGEWSHHAGEQREDTGRVDELVAPAIR